MKTLPLMHGGDAIVDDEDYERLKDRRWYVLPKTGYIQSSDKHHEMLHIAILGIAPDGLEWDHRNRNKRDNRRENFRTATHSQNCANSDKHRNNTTGYKGVGPFKPRPGIYRARIRVNTRLIFLGYFRDKIEAAKAYDTAAIRFFGEFAVTNF